MKCDGVKERFRSNSLIYIVGNVSLMLNFMDHLAQCFGHFGHLLSSIYSSNVANKFNSKFCTFVHYNIFNTVKVINKRLRST